MTSLPISIKFNVLTWNYGEHTIEKLTDVLKGLINGEVDDNTAYVLGLQEVNSKQVFQIVEETKKINSNYKILHHTCNTNISIGSLNKFVLLTIVISKLSITMSENSCKGRASSMPTSRWTISPKVVATKGDNIMRIRVADKTVAVINVHLPLDSGEYQISNLNSLFSTEYKTKYKLFLGDFNCRSMITDNCIKDMCVIPYAKRVEGSTSTLQELMNGETNDAIMRKIREEDSLHKMCGINSYTTNQLVKSKVSEQTSVAELSETIKDIIYNSIPPNVGNDFLANSELLASYNVDSEGKYALTKTKNDKTLYCPPGLADRIFSIGFEKGDEFKYKTLQIIGNDHLPVLCTGLMLPIKSVGVKKHTRKNKLPKRKRRRSLCTRKPI